MSLSEKMDEELARNTKDPPKVITNVQTEAEVHTEGHEDGVEEGSLGSQFAHCVKSEFSKGMDDLAEVAPELSIGEQHALEDSRGEASSYESMATLSLHEVLPSPLPIVILNFLSETFRVYSHMLFHLTEC